MVTQDTLSWGVVLSEGVVWRSPQMCAHRAPSAREEPWEHVGPVHMHVHMYVCRCVYVHM